MQNNQGNAQPSIPDHFYEKYENMGFSREEILNAYHNVQNHNDENQFIDILFKIREINQTQQQFQQKGGAVAINEEDEQYQKVLMESYQTAHGLYLDFQNPEQQLRQSGIPIGLKNLGNTCYFNSLLQIYFMNYQFFKEIFEFKPPTQEKYQDEQSKSRIENSIKLINNLKKLFANMTLSMQKYVDPSDVLKSIVDDKGNFVKIGNQEDIGEYNFIFLSRIEDGLLAQEKYEQQLLQKEEFSQQSIVSKNESFKISQEEAKDLQIQKNFSKDIMKSSLYDQSFSQNLLEKQITSISQIFMGKTISQLSYMKASTNERIYSQEVEVPFNIIYLDLKDNNLYDSWEKTYFSEIEGYKLETGEYVNANKEIYISTCPGVLFFTIHRVLYNKEMNMTVKLNSKFEFEKEIYIDRFLKQNKNDCTIIRDRVNELKRKEQQLKESISKFEIENINLINILQQTQNFLQYQQKNEKNVQQSQSLTGDPQFLNDPCLVGILPNQDANSITNSISLIQQYQQIIQERFNALKQNLESIQAKIKHAYDDIKKLEPYLLNAIIMHEGSADSGHYFAYIYDIECNQWRKYNDTFIKNEEEETVLKNAMGGDSYANAYCLIYTQQKYLIPHDMQTKKLRNYQIQFHQFNRNTMDIEQEVQIDVYSQMVQHDLQLYSEIYDSNQKFEKQLLQNKQENDIKSIMNNYESRFDNVIKFSQNYKIDIKEENQKWKPPILINFPTFLYLDEIIKNKCTERNSIYKYFLFECSIKNCLQDQQITIKNLIQNQNYKDYYQMIKDLNQKLNQLKKIEDFDIPQWKLTVLKEYSTDYIQNLQLAIYLILGYQKCLDEQFDQALQIFNICLDINSSKENQYFCKLLQQSKNCLVFPFLSKISNQINHLNNISLEQQVYIIYFQIYTNNQNQIFKSLQLILAFTQKYWNNLVSIKEQINMWIKDIISEIQSKCQNKLQLEEITQIFPSLFFNTQFTDQQIILLLQYQNQKKNYLKELQQRIEKAQDIYSYDFCMKEDKLNNLLNELFNKNFENFRKWNQLFLKLQKQEIQPLSIEQRKIEGYQN